MSEVHQIIPEEMKAASNAAKGAAERAIGHSSSTAMEEAGEALPGSDVFSYLPELGSKWDKNISDWAKQAKEFGDEIALVSADDQSTDGHVGDAFYLLPWEK